MSEKPSEWFEDSYAKEWLSNVSERTKKNYLERFPKWLAFVKMSPTEQIEKRIKDLASRELRLEPRIITLVIIKPIS